MDSIKTLGTTKFAMRKAMLRINAISSAKSTEEAVFIFGAATADITAYAELKAIPEKVWANLLGDADAAYNSHPSAGDTSERFLA
ncbi:hypothetical protein [Pseudomonas syringae]|uniref:hypothetical protein n=1 Tax=Pseudomonas syringae TaxID=317 RepID=UPI000BB5AE71|nr:hypothetical protein [Pseudomonas syringae]PBP46179.1 hypothetical protein CCL13_12325 [Pseudomonas syringae]